MKQQALGLIETHGLVAAIEAADAALKTAAVELINYTKVTGGLVTVAVSGEVAAVQAAVAAGSAAAAKVGQLVSQHVIPRPLADLRLLVGKDDGGPEPSGPADHSSGPAAPEECAAMARPPELRDSQQDPGDAVKEEATEGEAAAREQLESLSVIKLRELARKTEGIAIQGRQISKANKEQLIYEIMRAKK